MRITFIKKTYHSKARYGLTAWTPPSLRNSIVLLGGFMAHMGDAAELDAEIVPGLINTKLKIIFHHRWKNISTETWWVLCMWNSC